MISEDIREKLNHKITEIENKGKEMPRCYGREYDETKGTYCQIPCIYRDECKTKYDEPKR